MPVRSKVAEIVEAPKVQRFITALIVLNAVTLGMETSPWLIDLFGPAFHIFDGAVLTVFVVEILAKLFAHGWRFFRDGWNVFDFLVVGVALIPASGPLSVLRAFRILRVLRLMSVVPQMRAVIQALISAIPGMLSIVGLIGLIFYVGSVLATNFFGAQFQDWFGNVGASMYTLFQVMTLESWSMGIVRPVMKSFPWAWAFFVPFILVTTFAVLNLFIGVIVDAMQSQHKAADEAQANADRERNTALLRQEIAELRAEIGALRESLQVR